MRVTKLCHNRNTANKFQYLFGSCFSKFFKMKIVATVMWYIYYKYYITGIYIF